MDSRQQKLQELIKRRKESIQQNKKTVIDHDTKIKPESAKAIRKRQQAQELLEKVEHAKQGIDHERIKNLEYTIEDTEAWNAKMEKKKEQADVGFTDYAQINYKKYKKIVKEFEPDLEKYEEMKNQEEFYTDVNGWKDHTPSREDLERLQNDIEKQRQKRKEFSRRRAFDQDADVYRWFDLGIISTREICVSTRRYPVHMISTLQKLKLILSAVLLCNKSLLYSLRNESNLACKSSSATASFAFRLPVGASTND
jgi:pre-mRNA-splicing factor SYF2